MSGETVFAASGDGWVPMGHLTSNGLVGGDLADDEQAHADRLSRVDLSAGSISFTVPMTRDQVRDAQLLLGLVTTAAPRGDLL